MKVKSKSDYKEKQHRRTAYRERKVAPLQEKNTFTPRSQEERLSTPWFHPLMVKLTRTKTEKEKHDCTLNEKIAMLNERKKK